MAPQGKGAWLVLAMIGLGVSAGLISTWYWMNKVHVVPDRVEGAGPVPFDPLKADAELRSIQDQYAALREAGRIEVAVEQLTRLVEKYPRYADVRAQLGLVLSDAGRMDDAYGHLQRCLDLDRDQPEVHMIAGTIATKREDLTQAAHHYSQAVGLAPDNGEYRVFLAQIQIKRAQFEQARITLLEALRLDSSLHEAHFCLSNLYARQPGQHMLELALTQIQKAIENTPISERHKQGAYVRRKATLLRRMNRPEESLRTLLGLPPADLAKIPVIEEMAISWQLLGRPDNGAKLYEEQLLRNPTEWRLAAGAAVWRLKAGETDVAQKHLATIRRIDPWAAVIPDLERKLKVVSAEQASR